jgi:tetratricopeptide (TPR) repeat protein
LATKLNKNKVIAAAQKYVEKGQFEKAIKEYAKIVEEDPRDVRIWLKIGDLHAKKGSPTEAIDTYSKVAEFYSEQGFYLKAVAVYKQILKIDGNLVEVNLRLAELYKQLGLLSDAMQQYEQVSNFYHQAGRTKEALTALRQIVDLDPQNVASRIKLAELYSKEQMRDEAVEEFSKAADFLRAENRIDDFVKVAERLVFHRPENIAVTKELSGIYLRKKDPRRALQKLQLAFKADPRDEETLEMLAQAFEDLGQLPKTVSVLKELGHIQAENGDQAKRLETFRRVLALAPDDDEARQAVADKAAGLPAFEEEPPPPASPIRQSRVAPRAEYYEPPPERGYQEPYPVDVEPSYEAPEHLEEVSSADFDDYGIQEVASDEAEAEELSAPAVPPAAFGDFSEEVAKILTEADVYIKYGLHEKAVEHLRQVFSRDPDNVEVHVKLKDLYLQLRRYSEAARELVFLGRQFMGRDRREAAECLNAALELDPEHREARTLLDTLEGAAAVRHMTTLVEENRSEVEPIALDAADIVEEIPIESPGRGQAKRGMPGALEDTTDAERRWRSPRSRESDFVDEFSTNRSEMRPGVGRSGIIELHGETTDTLGGGTPSSEIIPLGEEAPQSEVHARIRREEETTSLEDELDEAEFFVQQNLFTEARAILEDLVARHPNNLLVQGKLADLQGLERGALSTPQPVPRRSAESNSDLAAELAAEFDEIERTDLGAEIRASYTVEDVFDEFKKGVDAQVEDEDSDTHYDLGIAYREMGLMDDAIVEFKFAMRSREKEALCHMMIGLCYIEKDMLSEAISEFKTGLYVEGITDRETIALYFELGQAYERLDDAREGLYYYEKVAKKDPRFRDVVSRMERIRRVTGNGEARRREGEADGGAASGDEDRVLPRDSR